MVGKDNIEFIKVEIEQAMETYRSLFSLSIHILTILIIANATVVGYSISARISGTLLICPLFPIMMIILAVYMFKLSLPIIFVVISLENKFGKANKDWLATTFISSIIGIKYIEELITISKIKNQEDRIKKLKLVKIPILGSGYGVIRGTLIILAIIQTIAPFVLTTYFNWRFL